MAERDHVTSPRGPTNPKIPGADHVPCKFSIGGNVIKLPFAHKFLRRTRNMPAGVVHCTSAGRRAVTKLPPRGEWTSEELGEIDRIRAVCVKHGGLEFECSHTDEGDPWCVVYEQTRGRIVLHIAGSIAAISLYHRPAPNLHAPPQCRSTPPLTLMMLGYGAGRAFIQAR
jgi:hypothetical protein